MNWAKEKIRRALIWLVFVVLIAALPLAVAYFAQGISPNAIAAKNPLQDLLKGGELFLVVAAISGDMIGRIVLKMIRPYHPLEAVTKFKTAGLMELLFVLLGASLAVASVIQYTILFMAVRHGSGTDAEAVVRISLSFFLMALVIGFFVIMTVED